MAFQKAEVFRATLVGIAIRMEDVTTATKTVAVVTVTATEAAKQIVTETATTEIDTVVEVVTGTKNATARGVVTVNATVVTPDGAIGIATFVAANQQEVQQTAQQFLTAERAREEDTQGSVQFEHVLTLNRSRNLQKRPWSTKLRWGLRSTSRSKKLKDKDVFQRYLVQRRCRREGKTDLYARRKMIQQAGRRYNSKKYRLIVRFTNRNVRVQAACATVLGDTTVAQVTSTEMPR